VEVVEQVVYSTPYPGHSSGQIGSQDIAFRRREKHIILIKHISRLTPPPPSGACLRRSGYAQAGHSPSTDTGVIMAALNGGALPLPRAAQALAPRTEGEGNRHALRVIPLPSRGGLS